MRRALRTVSKKTTTESCQTGAFCTASLFLHAETSTELVHYCCTCRSHKLST